MKISLQIKNRISEAIVVTLVKYDSEARVFRKADEDLLYVFQRNYLRMLWVLGSADLTYFKK